jgi:hypothetical protein
MTIFRYRHVVAVVLAATTVAGCGGGSPLGGFPAVAPTSAAKVSPSRPAAADGTNYAACADGTCEVAVSGPVQINVASPAVTLSVTTVNPGTVDFGLTPPDSGISLGATLETHCTATFSNGGGLLVCSHDRTEPVPRPSTGQLVLDLVDITAGTAILRLAGA